MDINKIVLVYFLIMARAAGVFFTAPVFNRKEVFGLTKIMLMFWLAGLLVYIVPYPTTLPSTPLDYILAILIEILLGYFIGFSLDLIVTALEFAGTIMDTQAGLSVASLLDPSSGRQITLISLLLKWVAFMMFLLVDGHHLVLSAIVHSYQLLPISGDFNLAAGSLEMLKTGSEIMLIGVQLAAPILLVVFLIDFGFGILNRVAEQINVFQLGFQVKPSISLLIFLLCTPNIAGSVYNILEVISNHLLHLFQALQSPVI
jgi:flagellar biosynthesis protein FliR